MATSDLSPSSKKGQTHVAEVNSPSDTSTTATSSARANPKRRVLGFVDSQVSSYFIAGGIAGATSRTVVSPLERLKIIQQVQPRSGSGQYRGVWKSLVRMWREEGFKGFMRGNGINCLRIVPYSAVQFTTYEQLKKLFTAQGTRPLDTPTRLTAGALAGVTSVCTTYPLDLVRSRLSIVSASLLPQTQTNTSAPSATAGARSGYHTVAAAVSGVATANVRSVTDLGIWGMTLKIMREEGGVRALYRGLTTTAMGVAPYVGINFASYEALRGVITPPGKTSVVRKLSCGALAGSISQTLTYPFDVLRRKMQVVGMGQGTLGYKYNGALEALREIIKHEGFIGLYRGLWPNLLKVAPSIATSQFAIEQEFRFFTYETVKELLYTG